VNGTSGLTDFHSHLMPGVDDGAKKPEDAAAALGAFRDDGVTQIITTPHFMGSLTQLPAKLEDRLAQLDAGWQQLREMVDVDAAKHPGEALRVERGVEVMLDVPDPDLSDPRLRLAGTDFVLVEFAGLQLPPMNAEFAVVALRQKGWFPVIAHPERYRNLSDYAQLVRFKEAGALLQVNAGSLFGDHGKTAATHAMSILTLGLADFVSSDYHARGTPRRVDFGRSLADAGFAEQGELLGAVNPARLLNGEWPLPVPPFTTPEADTAATSVAEKARPGWTRLFGGR
jgi:protein-tyrosine phosphatase